MSQPWPLDRNVERGCPNQRPASKRLGLGSLTVYLRVSLEQSPRKYEHSTERQSDFGSRPDEMSVSLINQ